MTKTMGLRERNRIRTRDEILIAMSLLLGERPFEGITVDDVAQRAGVSRGTIYAYFPDGRDQLVRDAYQRIAEGVSRRGTAEREKHAGTTDRVVALATVLADTAVTPEGRFYGQLRPGAIGALSGVTGTASRLFLTMLTADLVEAADRGELRTGAPAEELALLLSGAVREIGVVAAREPERAPELLRALRLVCESLLHPTGH